MSPEELQRALVELLQRRRALTGDPDVVRFAAEHLTGSDLLSPVEQLEIYRQQFWLRHTSALVEDYPAVGRILGQEAWQELVEGYLGTYPPTGHSLRDLGGRFPEFVASNGAWLEHHELVTEMARLEWAYVELFDAAEAAPLDPRQLAEVEPAGFEAVRLVLSPALRLLRTRYPVTTLRRRLLDAPHDNVAIPAPAPNRLVLYREGLQFRHEALQEPPFTLLEALAAQSSLGAACEAACALGTSAAERVRNEVAEWFADWVRRGWIVGLAR